MTEVPIRMNHQKSTLTKSPGLLISCEGIDGCGKSLLAQNLYNALTAKNIPTLLTKEPGGTALGQKLRAMLNHSKDIKKTGLAEFLLFAADRAQHFSELIIPALKQGTIIISDRMADSSLAYQGYGRGLDLEKIKQTNAWAMQNHQPDLTFYLRIDFKTAQSRYMQRNETPTSFEQEQEAFWHKVHHGFETIFANKSNVVILDATLSPEELTTLALDAIVKL